MTDRPTYKDYCKIGVIGGMGPETSATFYQCLTEIFQKERGARHNFEFPEMLIHNVPSPDNVEAGVDEALLAYLIRSAQLLENAGMDLLVIPCNSAHVHFDAVTEHVRIPILNILAETAEVVKRSGLDEVLVIGTKSTLGYNLYPPHLEARGVKALTPNADDQEEITRIIMTVCDGSVDLGVRQALIALIGRYPSARGVVLGCTELPLVAQPKHLPLPAFDTLQILVRATFERCVGHISL